MSSKNRVNPDHYKLAGRDKPGKAVLRPPLQKSGKVNPVPQLGGKSTGKVQSRASRPSRGAIEQRRTRADMDELQQPSKTGMRSSSQKEQSVHNAGAPIPPARPTPGAFGKTGSLSPTEEEIIHTEPAPAEERDDFLERRRRENKKARK
jgi:hypothetical protein